MAHDKRFVIVQKENHGLSREAVILMDRETGVQYLFFQSGYGGGLTPLLSRDGTPIIAARGTDRL